MTNLQALDTLTTYSNISKTRLLIQITLCRNARKQMDISKKNRFSAEKTINCFNSHREQKIRYQYVKYSSGFFASPMLPIFSSTKLELLCQSEMTSWYYIVTKSSIVDDLWMQDPLLVCFFLWETLPKDQHLTKSTFTYSTSKWRALEQGVKSVQS